MSIADKLKTVAQKMEDVYRTGLFKYAPKSTASGESILLENSAPEPFVDMVAHGNSWQNGTPSPNNPIPIESAKEVKVLGGNTEQTLILPYALGGIDGKRDVIRFAEKKRVQNVMRYKLSDFEWIQGQPNYDGDGMTFYAVSSLFDGTSRVFTTHFKPIYDTGQAWEITKLGEIMIVNGYAIICTTHSNLEELNVWLNESDAEIELQLAEPIEEDLTDEQIYAFKRLRANSPKTTIIGQGQVDVTYIVDNRQ